MNPIDKPLFTFHSVGEISNDVVKGSMFRLGLAVAVGFLLVISHNRLPFPSSKLLVITTVFFFVNLLILSMHKIKRLSDTLYAASSYCDALLAPFIFWTTGGFISPFLLTNFISALGSGLIYGSHESNYARNLVLINLLSYIAVSFLQKYGLLNNDVAYSAELMKNDLFFYIVVITVCTVFFACFVIIKDEMRVKMDQLSKAYQQLVEGTTSVTGEDFFDVLTRNLLEITKVKHALVGEINRRGDRFDILAGYSDGRKIDNRYPVSNLLKNTVSSAPDYITVKTTGTGPDDLFKVFNASFYCGIAFKNDQTRTNGVLCILNDEPPVNSAIIGHLLEIFVSRLKAELERNYYEEEKKAIEAQLAHAHKMEAIGQLAGGIAHDFNNILTGIIGYSETLQKKLQDNEHLCYQAVQVKKAAIRASELTNQLLSFARKGKYQTKPVDIHKLITEVIRMLQHTIDKRIQIREHLSAECPFTLGDPARLQSALLNLALNARDAMPDGGMMTFTTGMRSIGENDALLQKISVPPGNYIIIDVSDTGTGMTDDIIDHLFEPFFTTKEKGKGTGLGLAAVYGCIKSHSGGISVESRLSAGSTFTMYLPSHAMEKYYDDTTRFSVISNTAGHVIMLVDDEPMVRELTAAYLSDNGYKVLTFEDGKDALAHFTEHHEEINLVLLDMMMPVMNGYDTFLGLRSINPSIQVLILSGFSADESVQKVLAMGNCGLLEKPFTQEVLLKKIHEVLPPVKSQD